MTISRRARTPSQVRLRSSCLLRSTIEMPPAGGAAGGLTAPSCHLMAMPDSKMTPLRRCGCSSTNGVHAAGAASLAVDPHLVEAEGVHQVEQPRRLPARSCAPHIGGASVMPCQSISTPMTWKLLREGGRWLREKVSMWPAAAVEHQQGFGVALPRLGDADAVALPLHEADVRAEEVHPDAVGSVRPGHMRLLVGRRRGAA